MGYEHTVLSIAGTGCSHPSLGSSHIPTLPFVPPPGYSLSSFGSPEADPETKRIQAVYVGDDARKHWCRGEKGDRPRNRDGWSPSEPAGVCILRTPWVVARTAEIYVKFSYSLYP